MSLGVSQIEYWREVNKPNKNNDNSNVKDAKEGGPGAIYLSYDVFLGLTVIGGLLALDHLYLRSPLTFIAKIIVNILTLGSWWLYDASQAVFNKDVVKVFGLGVPGMGPKGIAAGVLASDVPDKKHMAFFIYGLAVIIGGIFGLDSFIVGDKQSGFIRLICLITGILAPVAIFWWLYNLGLFLFKPKDVTNKYWEYFGAPQPAESRMSIGEKLFTKLPFFEKIFGPVSKVKTTVVNTAEGVVNTAETLGEALSENPVKATESIVTDQFDYIENKINTATDTAGEILTGPVRLVGERVNKIITNTADKFSGQLKPAINTALLPVKGAITAAVEPVLAAAAPFKATLNTGLATAQTGLQVAQDGLALGKTALNTGSAIASRTLNVIDDTAKAATQALTLAPSASALASGLTTVAAQKALNKLNQQGGGTGDLGVLPYVMMGTLALIVVSGLVITYRRFRQNEQPRKDDSPPEPGVLRESNKEKSS